MFRLGFIAGPTIGGLLGGVNLRMPFFIAAALTLANVGYGLLVLPESHPADKSRPVRWAVANPAGALLGLARRADIAPLAWHRLCSDAARQMLYPLFALGTIGSVAAAASQSWISRAIGAHEQGSVQGALASIGSLTETAVPIPATALLAWSVTVHVPGLVFLVGAAILIVATVLAARATTPA